MASQTLRHSSAVGIHLWQSLKTGKDSGKLSLQTGNLSGNLWATYGHLFNPFQSISVRKATGFPKRRSKLNLSLNHEKNRGNKWLRQLEHPKSFSSPQNISKQEDLSSKVANLTAFT